MALTSKQERFCQEVVKQATYSDAYRIAYDAENMSDETINRKASELMANGKITARVDSLRKRVEDKAIYTVEQSIKRDLSLIERYEGALAVLEDINATSKDIEVAERLIRYIGQSGYSSAQDRISKQSGFYEKDNKQKNPDVKPPSITFTKPTNETK